MSSVITRCKWCGTDPLYVRDHDEEWGVQLHDDRRLFEMLILEGAQAGLSWITILRKRPAYRHAVKHSIYVHPEHLRSGVGRLLLPALIEACTAEGFRQMIGYVDAENLPSQQLHEAFGFHQAGLLQGVGYKFGRWTDTLLMQRTLGEGGATPPVEPSANESYSRAT